MSELFSPLTDIKPSATIAMNALAQKKRALGEVVYNLSVGEPVVPTPSAIQDAAILAIKQGKTLYPPVAGIAELREEASLWMNTQYSAKYDYEQSIVTCGGKFGLYLLFQALIQQGDEVLIVAPYWVSYPQMVRLFGGVPVIIETEPQNWKATAEMIEKKCTDKTKLLILNNGGNPTGILYSRQELEAILRVAVKKNIIVISDEVYSGLAYDGLEYASASSFPDMQDNIMVVQSCSKHFAMTGWRVGFVFGRKDIVGKLTTIQGQSTSGTSGISQWAALAAFQNAGEFVPKIMQIMQERRDAFVSIFKEFFGIALPVPNAGLYFFIPLKAFGVLENDDEKFCYKALEEGNVALVPGIAFGARGYARASFGGAIDDIRNGLRALAEYCKR